MSRPNRSSSEEFIDAALVTITLLAAWSFALPPRLPLDALGSTAFSILISGALLFFGVRSVLGGRHKPLHRSRVAYSFGLVVAGVTAAFGSTADFSKPAAVTGASVLALIAVSLAAIGLRAYVVGPNPKGRLPAIVRDISWWMPMGTPITLWLVSFSLGQNPHEVSQLTQIFGSITSVLMMIRVAVVAARVRRHSDALAIEKDRLWALAHTDSLTNLANRTWLQRHLERQLEDARQNNYAILFCDLDRFKIVNDSLGHVLGDDLLRAVAQRWLGILPDNVKLTRVGGDEFVLAGAITELEAAGVADLLHRSLEDPFVIDGHQLTVSTSVGIALYKDGTTAEELIRDADVSLYVAKEQGVGTTRHFDSDMRDKALRRLEIEKGLRPAISNGDIVVHLQPLMLLADGSIVHLEALLRWNHPKLGMVPPPEVIDVAEETGLIVPLGRHIIDVSLDALVQLDADGFHIGAVAVNTSASQLTFGNFPQTVADALQRHNLEPSRLVVEVTEGVLLELEGPAVTSLTKLTDMGVKIALDDFGTGYSSLSYLGQLGIDQLKLDRSFLDSRRHAGNVVVEGVVNIAHKLGMPVVAEGVETFEQAADLRRMGCDLVQGYAYSRPLPLDELREWLHNNRANAAAAAAAVPLGSTASARLSA